MSLENKVKMLSEYAQYAPEALIPFGSGKEDEDDTIDLGIFDPGYVLVYIQYKTKHTEAKVGLMKDNQLRVVDPMKVRLSLWSPNIVITNCDIWAKVVKSMKENEEYSLMQENYYRRMVIDKPKALPSYIRDILLKHHLNLYPMMVDHYFIKEDEKGDLLF
ncbi:hypothetical protein GYB22_04465 [bacterium]|nr:hypothetical protein [bacterium]